MKKTLVLYNYVFQHELNEAYFKEGFQNLVQVFG